MLLFCSRKQEFINLIFYNLTSHRKPITRLPQLADGRLLPPIYFRGCPSNSIDDPITGRQSGTILLVLITPPPYPLYTHTHTQTFCLEQREREAADPSTRSFQSGSPRTELNRSQIFVRKSAESCARGWHRECSSPSLTTCQCHSLTLLFLQLSWSVWSLVVTELFVACKHTQKSLSWIVRRLNPWRIYFISLISEFLLWIGRRREEKGVRFHAFWSHLMMGHRSCHLPRG